MCTGPSHACHVLLDSTYMNESLDGARAGFGHGVFGWYLRQYVQVQRNRWFKPQLFCPRNDFEPAGSISTHSCEFRGMNDPYSDGYVPGDHRRAEFGMDQGRCDQKEMCCYGANKTACAGWGNFRRRNTTYYVIALVPDITNNFHDQVLPFIDLQDNENMRTRISKLASLAAIDIENGTVGLTEFAMSSVFFL